jgi:hypothetical protein
VRNGAGTPFVAFCSPTFFCARETAAQLLSSGTKKRRQPITLGEMDYKYFDIFTQIFKY